MHAKGTGVADQPALDMEQEGNSASLAKIELDSRAGVPARERWAPVDWRLGGGLR